MYIPKHFKMQDNERAFQFIQKYNFGILVGVEDGIPIATHLPFVIEKRADDWYLISHLSAQNSHAKLLYNQKCLIIFSEPHAYISPKLYNSAINVPTWNYMAVHTYGLSTVLEDDREKLEAMKRMIMSFEPSYMEQFKNLPDKYVKSLLQGIVAFEMRIDKLEAKEKLSQNKSAEDRQNVMKHLLESKDTNHIDLGEFMREQ